MSDSHSAATERAVIGGYVLRQLHTLDSSLEDVDLPQTPVTSVIVNTRELRKPFPHWQQPLTSLMINADDVMAISGNAVTLFYISGESEHFTPFEERDSQFRDASAFHRFLERCAKTSTHRDKERVVARLRDLYLWGMDEEAEDEPLSTRSVEQLFEFTHAMPDLKFPDLTLAGDGSLIASYRGISESRLVLQFASHGDPRFVLHSPDPTSLFVLRKLFGSASISSIARTLRIEGVAVFFRE